jgi:hypothetical protein
MSFVVIIFILYYNTQQINSLTALILPLSFSKITFIEDLGDTISIDSTLNSTIFYSCNIEETSNLIKNLEDDVNYVVNIEFVMDISLIDSDLNIPRMHLSQPFVINKYSSSTTVTMFINRQLDLMIDYYYLDDLILLEMQEKLGPVVFVHYAKIL